MSLNSLACIVSARASAVLASPYALPGYAVARITMGLTLPASLVTVILSDFANLVLLLLAIEQSRQAATVEKGVIALATVHPKIDEQQVQAPN